jgi:F-box protein 18 (helicase)
MLNLYRGRPEKVELLQMKKFKNFEEIAALIQGDDEGDGVDQELEWYFEKLIKPYGDELPDLINKIRSRSVSPESANVSFSTAHRAKGLEWKNVVMLEDFWRPRPITPDSPLSEDEKEEVNAIYVAMTRASMSIDYGSVISKWLESKTIT